ncbi:MAG: LPS biosynthesis flippase [Bacteroidales bacterium]|nr:LPS biosynthesis flippase [Bacteroidales bacterium]MCF8456388.1 LPS biosynthesis flippase [Bacteroidales bacterium]
MRKLIEKGLWLITKGEERSVKAKKNILYSLLIRGVSMVTTFFLVPITLGFVDPVEYGIWITLGSVINWFSVFDVGLGNGLRNKFAEAIANNNKELAKTYVSTTYAGLIIIFGIIFLLFLSVFPFVEWDVIFKAGPEHRHGLRILVLAIFAFFVLRFILQIIGTILMADQRPALASLTEPIANLISLVVIYILSKSMEGSLLSLGLILGSTPILVLIIFNYIFYRKDYRQYIPSWKYVSYPYFKELMGLGFSFFVIQIATLLIFTTDTMIITQLEELGPKEVTPYAVARQYFGFISALFFLVVRPFWSAFTEAYVKDDTDWIRGIVRKLIYGWIITVIGIIFLIFISGWFYDMWLPADRIFEIPIMLSVCMGLFMMILTWNTLFGYLINGSGKIKLQYYVSIINAVVNIPLSILLASYFGLGSTGVILATSLVMFPGAILYPIQLFKIINKKASGIWGR